MRISPELFVAVHQFYARQTPLLDAHRLEEFLATFTDDAVLELRPNGWSLEGRATILAAMRESGDEAKGESGLTYRHWYDQVLIEPAADGAVTVGYQAMVSLTDQAGHVTFEPTNHVDDVLVIRDGELLVRRRTVTHDTPRWVERVPAS